MPGKNAVVRVRSKFALFLFVREQAENKTAGDRDPGIHGDIAIKLRLKDFAHSARSHRSSCNRLAFSDLLRLSCATRVESGEACIVRHPSSAENSRFPSFSSYFARATAEFVDPKMVLASASVPAVNRQPKLLQNSSACSLSSKQRTKISSEPSEALRSNSGYHSVFALEM